MEFRPGTSDEKVFNEIFVKRVYEKKGFQIEPGDVFVDLGGYCGFFSLYAISRGASVRAIYEPFAESVRCIYANTAGLSISIVQAAVASQQGSGSFFVHLDGNFQRNTLVNSFKRKKLHIDTVEVKAFRDVVQLGDCVKMDIEGSEMDILDKDELAIAKLKKLVLEYHFDKDSELEHYYRRLGMLARHFKHVCYERRLVKGKPKGSYLFWPHGRMIYCWGK
jgi:FkbM family methyltransferase